MKTVLMLFTLVILCVHFGRAAGDNLLWGNDVAVSTSEPNGRPSGTARPNGTVYVAVPDTGSPSGYVVNLYKSTDHGSTWTLASAGITSATPFSKVKMVRTGFDSIYCLAQSGNSIFTWNVEAPVPTLFTGEAARDFDIAASSTSNDLFIFVDVQTTAQIRRYGSVDGGRTWGGAGLVTSSGAHPRIYMSTGDTLVLNYYGPVLADTTASVIRAARYRRSGPGALTSMTFIDVSTEAVHKDQFASVIHSGIVWFFYTAGDSGSRDIKCRVSTDNGATYMPAFSVADDVLVDEYWFDAKHWWGGCNVVYVADTSVGMDDVVRTYADIGNPAAFAPVVAFSEHPPVYSPMLYIPTAIAFGDTDGDLGAIWVGEDGSDRRLYWDRLGAGVTGVVSSGNETPDSYSLFQNYPNPFNPSTEISFRIPTSEFVTLKVYDVLGREVRTLVAGDLKPGNYLIDFNASDLSSGVYFYQLNVKSHTDTKKLMLLR